MITKPQITKPQKEQNREIKLMPTTGGDLKEIKEMRPTTKDVKNLD